MNANTSAHESKTTKHVAALTGHIETLTKHLDTNPEDGAAHKALRACRTERARVQGQLSR